MDESSCKPGDSILHQTSKDTKHDTRDGRPRSPLRNKARTDGPEAEEKEDLGERNKIPEQDNQEDCNPSSIQTQENPDPQSLENMSEEKQLLTDTDKMIPMKSEHERIVCSPSDANEAIRRKENKQSVTVPDIEEEPPVDMLEEKLKLGERNKILEQGCPELPRSNTLKDEKLRDLRTERKQNKENYSVTIESFETQIKNLLAKCDEGKGREKRLETENNKLKDENKKYDEELKEIRKEIDCVYNDCYLQFISENLKTKKLEDEIHKLKKEIVSLKNCIVCSLEEKQYVINPCGHYGLCQHCFAKKDRFKKKCPFCRGEIKGYAKVYNT